MEATTFCHFNELRKVEEAAAGASQNKHGFDEAKTSHYERENVVQPQVITKLGPRELLLPIFIRMQLRSS